MESHLSRDTFCELVVRQNCHLEDAQDPGGTGEGKSSDCIMQMCSAGRLDSK